MAWLPDHREFPAGFGHGLMAVASRPPFQAPGIVSEAATTTHPSRSCRWPKGRAGMALEHLQSGGTV
jgi:hypothetical protein